jgi:hypothetical protein
MDLGPMQAIALSSGEWGWTYNQLDELKSLRRYFQRIVSPGATGGNEPGPGEPWWYLVPDVDEEDPTEGEFMRPAVTIELIDTGPSLDGGGSATRPQYDVEHSVVLKVYGETRLGTIELAERVFAALNAGGRDGASYRPQMWAFPLGAMLARRMRVLRPSLSMGMQGTDDEGKWSRPITLRVRAPRLRPVHARPVIERIQF